MDKNKPKASPTILKLLNNRVHRSYIGGALIDEWQGLKAAGDNDRPEEWLASIVEARNENFIQGEGLSEVLTAERQTEKLIDMVQADGERVLGKAHTAKYGANTGVLTKVLDAAARLSIQVHPTKSYSRKFFSTEYGKTEAWYIMGGREIDGEPPYVLLGFKPGITRSLWKKYFEEQDIDGMINALHKFYVNAGDVFLIEGGLPHAIGAGCFLIEIQEPTDYTMRVERKAFDGSPLADELCHQGLGFEAMLDCFIYDSLSREETKKRYFKEPWLLVDENGNRLISLIGPGDTDCFSMSKLYITSGFTWNDNSFKTLIILSGAGTLLHGGNGIGVKQGESYFLPADLGEIYIENSFGTPLEIIVCYPPK
jgi:mannose-6-phosphate isomerase